MKGIMNPCAPSSLALNPTARSVPTATLAGKTIMLARSLPALLPQHPCCGYSWSSPCCHYSVRLFLAHHPEPPPRPGLPPQREHQNIQHVRGLFAYCPGPLVLCWRLQLLRAGRGHPA
eukprot:597957-Pyramimonas_sp.AAC.1